MGSIVGSCLDTVGSLAEKKGLKLIRKGDFSGAWVNGDMTKLRQVILNLLSNSIKFTEKGSVIVEILKTNDMVKISVIDTGIGLTKEQKGKIFERFTQADENISRKFGGTGLGVTISAKIIEMHGGELIVDSKMGEGSTFSFQLPIIITEESRLPVKSSNTNDINFNGGVNKIKVCVVDDDPDVLDLVGKYLCDTEYNLIAITDPSKALSEIEHCKPDMILLDIVMPEKDGWTVLQELKHSDKVKSIPVVLISSYTEEGIGVHLGAVGFLPKPLSRASLLKRIDKITKKEKDKKREREESEDIKIFVVDDSKNDRQIFKKQLSELPCYIHEFDSGKSVINSIKDKNVPDLIVLDLSMPNMDGFEVIRELRKLENLDKIPVIILTAMDLSFSQLEYLEARSNEILRKGGISKQELLMSIDKVLDENSEEASI